MQKPLTIPMPRFHSNKLKRQFNQAKQKAQSLINHIFGRWYCGYCKKHHSLRVVEFDYSDGITDNICSLGLEYSKIALGKDIRDSVKYKNCRYINLDGRLCDIVYKKFIEGD